MPTKKKPESRADSTGAEELGGKTGGSSALDQYFSKVNCRAGEVIFKDGDPGTGAYRVLEGELEVIKAGERGEVVLARLGPGAVFGEMSLIDRWPRSATVRAATDVSLLYIDARSYEQELSRSSRIIRELVGVFSARLRDADKTVVHLTDEKIKEHGVAELSRKELALINHIARAGAYLQNIFEWEEACEFIRKSLLALGFRQLKLRSTDAKPGFRDLVTLTAEEEEGDRYELQFHGGSRCGLLSLLAPPGKLKERYREILLVYNSLLSSCLAKSETYAALLSISNQVEQYISSTRIQEVFKDFKNSMENFSCRCMDRLVAIPERLEGGEKIEDIAFELTTEFQEIDRLSQEVELIRKVFDNILRIIAGQLLTESGDYDKQIDKRGDQKAVDDILSSEGRL